MTVSTYKPGLTCSCPDYQNANVAANACLTCPNGCFLQWQSTPCHFHWLNVSDDLWWIDLLLLDHRRHDPGNTSTASYFTDRHHAHFGTCRCRPPLVFSLKSSICVSPLLHRVHHDLVRYGLDRDNIPSCYCQATPYDRGH